MLGFGYAMAFVGRAQKHPNPLDGYALATPLHVRPDDSVVAAGRGYEVAWKNGRADRYTAWYAHSNGTCVSNIRLVSGSTAMELCEPDFHQDLNGDRQIGVLTTALLTTTSPQSASEPAQSNAVISAGTTLELSSAYNVTVTFAAPTGTLKTSSSFAGIVVGMTGEDTIDLVDMNFATVQAPVFSGNSTHGTLTVTDGTHVANLALQGNYLASSWTVSNDGNGGTNIVDPVTGRIFYIDFSSGSDSNSGTSTNSSWKLAPGMTGFSGSYSHQAGDRFIFKGGVTWDYTALPLKITIGGTASNGDYYGVDKTWYTGSSWTRPIFDGGYAVSNIIDVGSNSYITIDNMVLAHVTSTSNFGYGLIYGYSPSFLTIENSYLHGWRTSASSDDAHGGVIFTNYNSNSITTIIDNSEIENSENSGAWNGVMVRMVGTIRNSSLHDNSSGVLFTLDFDHNVLYNVSYPQGSFDPNYHVNGVYLDPQTMGQTVGYIRNSIFHDVGGGANMSYLNGRFSTIYNYNNIYYGNISAQKAIEIEPYDYGSNKTSGTYYVFNNTGFLTSGPFIHVVNRGGTPQPALIAVENNNVIGPSGTQVDDNGPSASWIRSNNLVQTPAIASAQGYTQANLWAPSSAFGGTVDTGVDPHSIFRTDIKGIVRPQGLAWDIGAYEYVSGSSGDGAAEITVLGNGVSIVDGDTTPGTGDGTEFGSVAQNSAAVVRTFTVRNDGGSILTLGTPALPVGFSLVAGDQLVSSLAPGASDTFQVQMSTTTTGTKSGEISFITNDSNENPFNFSIAGTVTTPPEITVLGNGVSIVDGDTTPGTGDGTEFGSVAQNSAAVVRTFTVRNDGGSILTLGTPTLPAGFSLVAGDQLVSSLAPGASDTFQVQMSTTTTGTKSGEISFITNDSNENPFNFSIAGTVSSGGGGTPMTSLFSNSNMTPQTYNDGKQLELGMNFESSVSGQINALKFYRSPGDTGPDVLDLWTATGTKLASATFTNTAASGWQTVALSPPVAIAANTNYVVSYHTTGAYVATPKFFTADFTNGVLTAPSTTTVGGNGVYAYGGSSTTGIFPTNTYNANNYWADVVFVSTIAPAEATATPAEITVLGNGVSIVDGDTTPGTGDGTEFGSVAQNSAAVVRTFTVRNDGGSILTLGTPALPVGFSLVAGDQLVSSLAPGASDTFQVQMSTTTTGTKSGEISFITNDSNENPFNFSIAGTVTTPPEITVLGNGVSIVDGDTTPGTGDGTEFGSVAQNSAAVVRTFTVRNDGGSILTLGTPTLPAGFSLVAGDQLVSSLAPGASDTFQVQMSTTTTGTKSGEISFITNDSNENPFNFSIAGTVSSGGGGTPMTSLFSNSNMTPQTYNDGKQLELGMNFESSVSGQINALKFYRSPGDTGPDVLDLWTATGTKLASATFTNTAASGWQTVALSPPVAIAANTNYVVSYHTTGAYVATPKFFTADFTNGVLTAPSTTTVGGNGVYAYGGSSTTGIFPTNTYNANNYWADVVFVSTIAPAEATATPAEITVLGNGVSIVDGDTTPGTGDGTEFGSVAQNSAAVVRTFTVRNDGGSILTLGTPALPVGFSLVAGDQLVSSLAPGASDTFQVQMSTTTTGTKSGEISFITNDSNENPFNFSIAGTVSSGGGGTPMTSLFSNSNMTPQTYNDGKQLELGMNFESSVSGQINALKFYRSPGDTGPDVLDLWTATGTKLASATFTNTAASGWQTVALSPPVAIAANTNYVVSYHTTGAYVATPKFFTADFTNGVLTAPSTTTVGGNGVYAYGGSSTTGIFPTNTYNANNYWADVVFVSTIAPAGVAGEAIHLGLTNPTDHSGSITVKVSRVPSGWTMSTGTDNGDGTWTVQTTDVDALSVISPQGYTGALALNVAESWINADGSSGSALVADNVEVYAKGAPIFAISGDDNLSGSSGDDLFVLAQPIGNDTIYSFDVARDKVDLLGFSGLSSFVDARSRLSENSNGDAVLTIAEGELVTFEGVSAASLTAKNFVFDHEIVTHNANSVIISDSALLPLSGAVNNSGTIELASIGGQTTLQVLANGLTLEGGGRVEFFDSNGNIVVGTTPDATLTNVDNIISGAGRVGDGQLMLHNEGAIIASGINALTIDTRANPVVNSGTLGATGSGGLNIQSDLANSGLLWANGGDIRIRGEVTGTGSALIDGVATFEIGGAFSQNVTLDASASATLKIDHAVDFTGAVAGFDSNDVFDLADIAFGVNTTLAYAEDSQRTGGTLTVSDGSHIATLALFGQFEAAGFQGARDAETGTLVTYNNPKAELSELPQLTRPCC